MAKKLVGARLDDDTIKYLREESIRLGFHHVMSEKLPNITKTIEFIIKEYKSKQLPQS